MRRAIWIVALVACGSKKEDKPAPPPPPPPPVEAAAPAPPAIDREALLAGKLPEGTPETEVINAQCQICHTVQYLTQQRLSEAAWKKTIDKMRKFGANLTDDEAASIVTFAARYWNPDLPGRTWTPGPPPPGALPLEAK